MSIVVIGHSGATGFGSDPSDPFRDAFENSWVTGSNPEVGSIYLRLAAAHPEYRGHATNLARDGATIDDMVFQAKSQLPSVQPKPGVVFIQGIDNDIRCDGSDEANYAPYGQKLSTVLSLVRARAPQAPIYVTSVPATAANFARAARRRPGALAEYSGTGACALYTESGALRPDGAKALQDVTNRYEDVVAAECAKVATCHFDGRALRRMVITTDDLTPDGSHLMASGQRKFADLAWTTFFSRPRPRA